MDPTFTATALVGGDGKVAGKGKDRKRLLISSLNTALPNGDHEFSDADADGSEIEDGEDKDEAGSKKTRAGLLAKLMNNDEDDDVDGGLEDDDDEDRDREDEDEDEYGDDEDGDYNAENYFDPGEGDDDFGDDDGGGDTF